jgi:hypothetical protein
MGKVKYRMRNRRELRRQLRWPVLVAVLVIAGLSGGQPPAPASGQDEPEPLKGALHLRVGDPADPGRRNLRLDQDRALPLKAHDRFFIEARLNRKAYLYVFWIGSDGKVGPIYPWAPGHWDRRPAKEEKTNRLDLPPKNNEAWEIPAGDAGLEAVVLLAREQRPLPREREADLARLLVGSTAQRRPSLDKAVWIENGREVVDRDAPSTKTRKSDDPVLRIRRLLQGKVQPLGDYSLAVLFPNQGGR